MRWTRVALAAAGAAVVGVLLVRQTPPGASARPADEAAPARLAPAPRAPASVTARPSRDVFTYADEAPPAADSAAAPHLPAPAPTALPPPPALSAEPTPDPLAPRLIGLVRRAAGLEAVLAIEGEVMVVKKGSRAGSYTVTAIDEDQGVRLQDAAGGALVLAPPPS